MDIIWYGQACFKLKTKEVAVLCDPYDFSIGIKPDKAWEADIVTISHNHYDHNNIQAVLGNPFVIDSPGEYEIKGISIFGFQTFHDNKKGLERGQNTIFVFDIEGIRVAHLGDLGHSLSEEILEQMNGIDILLIPVGGVYTLSLKEALEVISDVEPKIIIPMHYKVPGLNLDIRSLDEFAKEVGLTGKEAIDKLSINKKTLPEEEEIIILKPRIK